MLEKRFWALGPRKKEGGGLICVLSASSLSSHVHCPSFVEVSKSGLKEVVVAPALKGWRCLSFESRSCDSLGTCRLQSVPPAASRDWLVPTATNSLG